MEATRRGKRLDCPVVKPLPVWVCWLLRGFTDGEVIYVNPRLDSAEKSRVILHELWHWERLRGSRLLRFLLDWRMLLLSVFLSLFFGVLKFWLLVLLTSIPLLVYLVEEMEVSGLNGELFQAKIYAAIFCLYICILFLGGLV